MKTKTVKFTVEVTDTGYSAYAVDYPVVTTGSDYEELKQNINDAFELYMEAAELDFKYELAPVLDVPQFFEYYNVINASALAKKIGMHQSLLAQYAKGHKTPSAKQVSRIVSGVQEIGKELASIKFQVA